MKKNGKEEIYYLRVVLLKWRKIFGQPIPKEFARSVYIGKPDEMQAFFSDLHNLAVKRGLLGATERGKIE